MTVDKNILSILESLIPFPTFILDDEGRIIDFNQKGKKFLPDATFNTLIYEILDKEFSNSLEKLLYEAKTYDKSVKEIIQTKNKDEQEEYELNVAPYSDDLQITYICTIRKVNEGKSAKELQKFTIVTEEINKILRDEDLLEIVQSVKSAFPFTFIGKAKIQKQIDMLEGYFWIKDTSRRFILVNQKFAHVLGVKAKQLEGRFEKDVLPHFQNKLFATIDNYILETTNSVVIDQINSSSPYGNKPYEIVEFPVLDIDNNVVAIIGVSQIDEGVERSDGTTKFDPFEILTQMNIPYLITDSSGIVTKTIPQIHQYFPNIEKLSGKNITEIVQDDALSESLSEFYGSKSSKKIALKIASGIELAGLKKFPKENNLLFYINDSSKSNLKTAGILKMYDAIMKISPQPMFIYDIENLKFMEVNDAAIKLYGYSKEEFLNMDLTDLYAPEDIQTLLESANKKSKTNEFTGPWRHMKKDGSAVVVELSKSPMDYKGKSAHINIIRDITDEVKNSKKIKMFRTAFENSSDLIFITDNDGFITYASDAVIKKLEYSKHDLDKKPFLSLLKDEKRAELNKELIHSDSKDSKKIKSELKKASGKMLEVTLIATPIYDYNGEKESITIIAKPKDKPIQVVTEKDSPKEVKRGVEPSFLSNVFHELLTPINVILGFIQEISDSIEKPTEDQKEAIDIIKENQKLLLQSMDTAAEYSALEDNKIKFKPEEIVFVDLLEEIQSTTERTARSNNLELTYGKISSSLKLTTDKHHFSILVTQFIKYAMQISDEGKLYLSAYSLKNDDCLISVKDKREGLSSKLMEGLDEIFTKDEDALRKNFGFSRITTKLFRKLIVSLNARNEVISRDGKPIEYGIIFPAVLEIEEEKEISAPKKETPRKEEILPKEKVTQKVEAEPSTTESKEEKQDVNINVNVSAPEEQKVEKPTAAKEPEITTPPPQQPAKPEVRERRPVQLEGMKCLYVEDQVDSQILFKVQMKELHEIEFATSFEEALPKIKSKEFDFIVMDINLEGEYNGLDALRVIQKLPGYQNTPVIAVTAYVLPGDRDKFIAAGFSDFISKPVLKDKLMNSLERIF